MVLLNAMLVIQFIMVTSLCRTQHVCWLGSPWAVLHPLAESHDGRTRRVQRKQAAHRAVRSLGIFFPPLEMALKDDSTTATIKLLMAEMRRLGDRIEGRCVGIEHSIGSVLTASASATTYDEPRCAAGLLFGEELIFLDGPVFDKEPFIFDEEPVFFSEGLIFDKEPGLDEETSYSAAAGVSVVCFDEGPIFDEEPGDFTTTGCGVVLFDGPDVSTAMVGHNSTASPRQASTTSNVNEELVLGSDLAARALVATVAVPSNSNINATSTCSTKCLSRDIDIVAPTVAYTISEEVAVVPVHIPSPPTTNGTSTSIGAVAFGEFNFKHVPAPVKATDVSSPKLLAEVELNTSPHDNHLTVCLSHNTNVAGFAGVTGTALTIFYPEMISYAVVVRCEQTMKCTTWKPWSPPTQVEIINFSSDVRPVLWPSFIMGYGYFASWDFCWLWKPPWLHPICLQTGCFPTVPVVSCGKPMECMLSLVWKPPWPLLKFLECIMVISMSAVCVATFVVVNIFRGAPITVYELPPHLVIISEDPISQVLASVQLSQIILFSQQKCDGSCGIAWLVWISIMLEYSADRAIGGVDAITVTGAIVLPTAWPSFNMDSVCLWNMGFILSDGIFVKYEWCTSVCQLLSCHFKLGINNSYTVLEKLPTWESGGFSPWSELSDTDLQFVFFIDTYLLDREYKRPYNYLRQWDPGILLATGTSEDSGSFQFVQSSDTPYPVMVRRQPVLGKEPTWRQGNFSP